MKIITIDAATDFIVDNVAYLTRFYDPDGTDSFVAVMTNGTSLQLTEDQYTEAKNYLAE